MDFFFDHNMGNALTELHLRAHNVIEKGFDLFGASTKYVPSKYGVFLIRTKHIVLPLTIEMIDHLLTI